MDRAHVMLYVLALASGLVGGTGDILLNHWAKVSHKPIYLLGGYACWILALVLFTVMLKKGMLADCVILFLLANCAVALVVGPVMFDDHMSTQKWAGVALAVFALVLMHTG
ncbi:MAG: hypothetical protein A3E36_00590 [Candidatus Andersenbacteria bacterium RIFCSPHIGHO2_12_FULL_45_11b]|uniref:EamA domain-containing protein n=1 Tax=Candidatus Andersenbacteria bacterium RIFCSPHIGHO2_12_FULL_45_11b TaxID=1797282 RepID=A0A1G1X592_9BACT|nr:MAG: hypothetical protein A3E36_00590 [Candidatus Andersenbacteria bacterium RIFCSPHIGHO2_12_FULL_45_11b]